MKELGHIQRTSSAVPGVVDVEVVSGVMTALTSVVPAVEDGETEVASVEDSPVVDVAPGDGDAVDAAPELFEVHPTRSTIETTARQDCRSGAKALRAAAL